MKLVTTLSFLVFSIFYLVGCADDAVGPLASGEGVGQFSLQSSKSGDDCEVPGYLYCYSKNTGNMEIFGGSEWVAGPKLLLFVHAETIPSKGYPGPGAGKRHSHSVEVLLYHDYEGSNETLISVSRDVQNDPGGECISAMQDIVYEDYNPAAEVVRDWDNPIADWDPCLNVTLGSEDVTAVITHSIGDVTETEVRELPVFP